MTTKRGAPCTDNTGSLFGEALGSAGLPALVEQDLWEVGARFARRVL